MDNLRNFSPHLPARAMAYALLIVLLMSVITGSLITLSSLNQARLDDGLAASRLQDNLGSGMGLLRSLPAHPFPKMAIDLYGRGKDSVYLEKIPWGVYDAGIVQAEVRSPIRLHGGHRAALLGSPSDKRTDAALYLMDRNRPLSLAGQTLIRGDAALPAAGVKRAMVAGTPFMGTRLVEGATSQSRRRLPRLDAARVEVFRSLFMEKTGISEIPRTLHQSFLDSTLYIVGQNILLDGVDLSGRIVVQASDAILVGEGCRLEDVVLVAPEITVEEGFIGNFQAFASEGIWLGEDVSLGHPSALVLLHENNPAEGVGITFGRGTFVHGFVGVLNMGGDPNKTLLHMQEGSRMQGMVYVEGKFQLQGGVDGYVACRSFYLKTPASIYDNYIFNGGIDRTALSPYFLFPPLLENAEGRSQGVVKWLD